MSNDNSPKPSNLSRRLFLAAGVGTPAALWVACNGAAAAPPAAPHNPPTPVPVAPPATGKPGNALATKTCLATEDNIEGPFFTANAPSRVVLINKQAKGTRLFLSGRVVDTRCRPIAGAVMEVWQANHKGDYDNRGFRFRATLNTTRKGEFQITTIIPGRYLNGRRYRPAHIHVKLHAKGYASLTTQLYFQGDPYNQGDPFIRSSLIMPMRSHKGGKAASYQFVLSRR